MNIVYALEELPKTITKSIFLAGPTPRGPEGNPWRQEAIKLLEGAEFDGTVYVPEPRDGKWHKEYDLQVEWEELCLNQSDCILFWVPRDLKAMPAFTTNIEWGRWENSGKLILGYPKDAEKMSYMDHYAEKLKIPVSSTLKDTLQSAIDFVGEGEERTGGERMVPLYIWKTPQFKAWYNTQTVEAGNRLDDARVLFNFRPANGSFVFLWILHVDVYVASEDRHKKNEFVIARTDISSVLMWQRREPIGNSEIVLVREFRSPAATDDGFIRELPGGSPPKVGESPEETAVEEVLEETGLNLMDSSRMKFVGAHQLAGTLSSHKAHLYSVELTDSEMDWLKAQRDVVHGADDEERTFIEVYTLDEILSGNAVDWTTLGMIASVVFNVSI